MREILYYAATMQSNFDKRTVHSGNLYQIFAYVKNKQIAFERAGENVEVSGMLLYAATDEDIQPDATYRMSGNRISATTLDLDRPFDEIRAQLDGIADMLTSPSAPGGVWVFRTVCFERVVLSSPGCLWPGRMDDHEEVLEAHA